MQVIVGRQSVLDVHEAQVTACVQVPGPDGERVQHVEPFQTMARLTGLAPVAAAVDVRDSEDAAGSRPECVSTHHVHGARWGRSSRGS